MPITIGPETVDTNANNGVCSFYYPRPVEVVVGTQRWLFLLGSAGATWRIKAYLRTGGAWVQQDTGNGPTVARVVGGNDVFGCPTYLLDPVSSTKVYCAYPRALDSTLAFVVFDTVSKTFGVPTTGGPLVTKVDVVFNGPPSSVYNDDTGGKCLLSYRPVDNKLIFNYQGPVEVVAGANCLRPYYVTYDLTGAAWGAAVDFGFAGINNPFQPQGIVTDQATSISYATFVKPNGGSNATTQEVWYVQVDSNDILHAAVMVTNDVRRDREPYVGYPALQKLGGNTILNIPYVSEDGTFLQANFQIRIARCLVGPAPVFALEDITAKGAASGPIGDAFITPSCAIDVSNNPNVFWVNNDGVTGYQIWWATSGAIGFGWSAPSSIYVVADIVNDFMERPVVSFLSGI